MNKLLAILVLTLATQSTLAQPESRRLELGYELADVLQSATMFEAYLKYCRAPMEEGPFDPKFAFRSDPSGFGGVSPQSAYWPEVEAAFQAYQQESCSYLTADRFRDYVARSYADRISTDDLVAAIAFYSSPLGKRLLSATLAINEAFQGYAQEQMALALKSAYPKVGAKLREIARSYQAAPR